MEMPSPRVHSGSDGIRVLDRQSASTNDDAVGIDRRSRRRRLARHRRIADGDRSMDGKAYPRRLSRSAAIRYCREGGGRLRQVEPRRDKLDVLRLEDGASFDNDVPSDQRQRLEARPAEHATFHTKGRATRGEEPEGRRVGNREDAVPRISGSGGEAAGRAEFDVVCGRGEEGARRHVQRGVLVKDNPGGIHEKEIRVRVDGAIDR